MKPGYAAFGSVFVSLFLVVGALDQIRADNTLEANGRHEESIPGIPYFTSTVFASRTDFTLPLAVPFAGPAILIFLFD